MASVIVTYESGWLLSSRTRSPLYQSDDDCVSDWPPVLWWFFQNFQRTENMGRKVHAQNQTTACRYMYIMITILCHIISPLLGCLRIDTLASQVIIILANHTHLTSHLAQSVTQSTTLQIQHILYESSFPLIKFLPLLSLMQ